MIEFGISQGLAYRHNFQDDIRNVHENEMLDRQARIDAEAKAKLIGDKFKFGKAFDTYNDTQLKKFSEEKLKQIGKFVDENRDFEINPAKYAVFNSLTDELTNNPIIQESARVEQHRQEMLQYLQKNPDMADSPRMRQQIDAYHTYAKMGTADPASLERKEWMFMPPTPYADIAKEGLQMGNAFGDFDRVPVNGWGHGAYKEVPKANALDATANSFYMQHKDQIDEEYRKKGFKTQFDYAKALITPGIKGRFDPGDLDYALKLEKLALDKKQAEASKQEGPSQQSAYQLDVLNRNVGSIPPDAAREMFSDQPAKMVALDRSGNQIQFNYRPVVWSDKFVTLSPEAAAKIGFTTNKPLKMMKGTVTIPYEEAKAKGIVSSGGFLWAHGTKDEGTDDVDNKYTGIARVRKDAKDKLVVDIDSYHPFDAQTYGLQGLYEKHVQTSKNVAPVGEQYENMTIIGRANSPSGRPIVKTSDGKLIYTDTNEEADPNNIQ